MFLIHRKMWLSLFVNDPKNKRLGCRSLDHFVLKPTETGRHYIAKSVEIGVKNKHSTDQLT